MSSTCYMKQVREKHVSPEIAHCLWSPKMDLIAIANSQGQVVLHRLSWQQVWVLNAPEEKTSVTALAWRPDSKILAVGYNSGKVLLLNVEDSSVIFDHDMNGEVSALAWHSYSSLTEPVIHKEEDGWSPYMYSLPPLGKSFSDSGRQNMTDAWQEPRLLQNQSELNVLYIGVVGCSIHLSAFGLLHIASIDLKLSVPFAHRILSVAPSSTLDFLSLVVEKTQDQTELCHFSVDCSVLSLRHKELHCIAQKYGQIHSIMTYINHTLTLIEEAWDSALIEMDAELAEYSSNVPANSVSAEFMQLLVFGYATENFKDFITMKITEGSLKKLRHSFDHCYSTMQRLVVKHLQQAAISLIFLLCQVRGMGERKDLYEHLGVLKSDTNESVAAVGSFLLKVSEFLQAIDASTKDFHVFLRWLSGVNLRLRREHVPSDLSRMSHFEISNLLNFLNESLEEVVIDPDGRSQSHFRLERTGQFLKKEKLKTKSESTPTPFARFLSENPSLAAHPCIFSHNPHTSLVQEHQSLVNSLTRMWQLPGAAIHSSLKVLSSTLLTTLNAETPPAVTQISQPDGSVACVVIPIMSKSSSFLVSEWGFPLNEKRRAGTFMMDGSNGPPHDLMTMIDTQFYSSDSLSVLMSDPGHSRNPTFAQFAYQSIRSELHEWGSMEGDFHTGDIPLIETLSQAINVSLIPEYVSWRRLETGSAALIAVSGPRRVVAVVGATKRRIRIYEMGTDEEEEDDEDFNDSKEDTLDVSKTTDEMADTSS